MVDIRDYIRLSEPAKAIIENFALSQEFKKFYNLISSKEKKSLIRHFIVNNVPFVFKEKPLLYEQITQYIADKLDISASEIKLIGSAKTGFSITPPPKYGKIFGEHSDLDFSIINEDLYYDLEYEFTYWADLFKQKQIRPLNDNENRFWFQNLDSGLGQINHGFIDTHFIPNRDLFPYTKKNNNSMWLIKKYLDENYNIKITKATASIYKNWISFANRLNRNTENVMKQIK